MSVCDVAFLRGSQEEMWQKLFQLHLSVEPASVLQWMLDRGVRQTLAAYGWGPDEAQGRVSNGSQEIARLAQRASRPDAAVSGAPGASGQRAASGVYRRRRPPVRQLGPRSLSPSRCPERRLLVGRRSAGCAGPALRRLQEDHPAVSIPRRAGVSLDDYVATVDGGAGFGGTLAAACFDSEGKALDRIDAWTTTSAVGRGGASCPLGVQRQTT